MSQGTRSAGLVAVVIIATLVTRTFLLLLVGLALVGAYHWWAGRKFERELREGQ